MITLFIAIGITVFAFIDRDDVDNSPNYIALFIAFLFLLLSVGEMGLSFTGSNSYPYDY